MARRIGMVVGSAIGLAVGVPVAIVMVASRPHFNIQSPDATIIWFALVFILLTVLPYVCAVFFGEIAEAVVQKVNKRRKPPAPPQAAVATDSRPRPREKLP